MARIRPITQVRAGPSTVHGSGAAPVIGTGSPQAAAAEIIGSGARIISGDGVLVAQNAAVSGNDSAYGGGNGFYSLSGHTLGYTHTTPTLPSPGATEVEASNLSELQSALLAGTRTINCTWLGTQTGNVTATSIEDVVINMRNDQHINGTVTLGGERYRWNGGNITEGQLVMAWSRDVLFDDVWIEADSQNAIDGGNTLGGSHPSLSKSIYRAMFQNCTFKTINGSLDGRDSYALFQDGGGDHRDCTFCNVKFIGAPESVQCTRFMSFERQTWIDCVVNEINGSGTFNTTGFRIHRDSDYCYLGNVQILGRLKLDTISGGETRSISNWRSRNLTLYDDDQANFASQNPMPNTGSVAETIMYSEFTSFSEGALPGISPMTDDGDNTRVPGWDGSTVQEDFEGDVVDYATYGAIRSA